MKTALLTLLISLISLPSLSFAATPIEEAKALESEMDRVPRDFTNSRTKAKQDDMVVQAANLIEKVLRRSQVDEPTLTAIARILVRGNDYDQEGFIIEKNFKAIQKHGRRLQRIFSKFEADGTFSKEMLDLVRMNVNIHDPERGASAAEPATNRSPAQADKNKSNRLLPKKAKQEDGAALQPCLIDDECPAQQAERSTLNATALKQLENVGEMTFSSYDPTTEPKKQK